MTWYLPVDRLVLGSRLLTRRRKFVFFGSPYFLRLQSYKLQLSMERQQNRLKLLFPEAAFLCGG